MSVSCPDCGAVAGYGHELAHKSDCPSLKRPFDFKALRRATPEELEEIRRRPRKPLTREEQVRLYTMPVDDDDQTQKQDEALEAAEKALNDRGIPT